MWSPFARPTPVVIPLECSGGQASITCTPWSAGESLAYQDGSHRFVKRDPEGKAAPEVAAGSLKMHAVSLIVTGADGFPPAPDGSPFDPRNPAHLLALDSVTYAEIERHALKVQPLPGSEQESKTETAAPSQGGSDLGPAVQMQAPATVTPLMPAPTTGSGWIADSVAPGPGPDEDPSPAL